ncbi:Hypothetical predicted protein [Olea europaea subsp. europaea]|uniref:Uncharacterized protein n=1 Tax=Olea europaea subsp. europaea TaxID=158383 RepID=A0A8S0PE18_OLEEU|nr:Hypothetical predicted protein [Olea europaea subsp. europaea]
MEKCPEKITVVVFLNAIMPDSENRPHLGTGICKDSIRCMARHPFETELVPVEANSNVVVSDNRRQEIRDRRPSKTHLRNSP